MPGWWWYLPYGNNETFWQTGKSWFIMIDIFARLPTCNVFQHLINSISAWIQQMAQGHWAFGHSAFGHWALGHWALWTLSTTDIEHCGHWALQTLSTADIEHYLTLSTIGHWALWTLSTIMSEVLNVRSAQCPKCSMSTVLNVQVLNVQMLNVPVLIVSESTTQIQLTRYQGAFIGIPLIMMLLAIVHFVWDTDALIWSSLSTL